MSARPTTAVLVAGMLVLVACGSDAQDTPSGPSDEPAGRQPPEDRAMRCPEPFARAPAAEDVIEIRRLVGLSEREARERAAEVDCTVRVVRRDGDSLPVTRDLRRNRINVEVVGDRVTRAVSVG
jgi:hypothetical protein